MGKSFIKLLTGVFFMAVLLIPDFTFSAEKCAHKSEVIKGVAVEKPVREVVKQLTPEEFFASLGSGGAGGPGGPGGAAGGPPGGGMPPGAGEDKSTPSVNIEDGKYNSTKTIKDFITAGEITDKYTSGLKINARGGTIGGVFVKGIGSEYILSGADIELNGDGSGEGAKAAGASSEDHSTFIIRNSKITTTGKSRPATAATKYSVMKVYNSTLTAHGGPEEELSASEKEKIKYRPFSGNARTHLAMSNSYNYFYYSTIIADGWGALSTDNGDGFVYLEANNCKVQTVNSGYGTYADTSCHNVFNNCDFDVASMAAILAGESDITFRDTNVKSRGYFTMIHCVMGSTSEVATLKVTGGDITTKDVGVIVKSANAIIRLDGVMMSSEKGILVKSAVNEDPNATKVNGKKVYGIHTTLRNMDVAGDIVHDDKDRTMTVYFEFAVLKGAIKDAIIIMDDSSRWTATADSRVTIMGNVDISQIDAPKGVTINAVAAQEGTFTLKSGGTLILKKV